MPRCPVCGDPVDLATTPTVPFCSERCRLVDIGRWLGESYGLPLSRRAGDAAGDSNADDVDPEA